MKIVITGANSATGMAILRCGSTQRDKAVTFVAAVRSKRAAKQIRHLAGAQNRVEQISYDDPEKLRNAFNGACAVIHLAGILVERPGSTYEQANVASTRGVAEAARQSEVKKLVLVSAIGADETSSNRYWRTKGQAEALVRSSGLCYTILRVPLLLGPDTEGAEALKRHVSRSTAMLINGGRNLQQPLYVDDLARAAIFAADPAVAPNTILNLVGPVSLPERELVKRAAHFLGRQIKVRSIPKAIVSFALAIRRRIGGPGFSTDALDVITADNNLDSQPGPAALGIQLTSLDEMIKQSVGER